MCDCVFNPEFSAYEWNKKESLRIFLPAKYSSSFIQYIKSSRLDLASHTLYIHNYDNIPSEDEMISVSARFKKVYSVNWLGSREIAEPIPIGLENFQLLRNGVPKDFEKLIKLGLPEFTERTIECLSSFSVSTNVPIRSEAQRFVDAQNEILKLNNFTTPKEFRKLLLNTKFILSPPGNGADCHRTWEAIYLGTVPIVLRNFWPFEHLSLPVLVVDTWEEIPQKIQEYKLSPRPIIGVRELANLFLE